MVQEKFRILLQLRSLNAIAGLTVDSACMPRRKRADGTIEMMAAVTGEKLKKLRRKRTVSVEVLGDTKVEARMAAGEVSRITAEGHTLRGFRFTREAVRTAIAWQGGDARPPTRHDDGWCGVL